jgi:hypothetical protein
MGLDTQMNPLSTGLKDVPLPTVLVNDIVPLCAGFDSSAVTRCSHPTRRDPKLLLHCFQMRGKWVVRGHGADE